MDRQDRFQAKVRRAFLEAEAGLVIMPLTKPLLDAFEPVGALEVATIAAADEQVDGAEPERRRDRRYRLTGEYLVVRSVQRAPPKPCAITSPTQAEAFELDVTPTIATHPQNKEMNSSTMQCGTHNFTPKSSKVLESRELDANGGAGEESPNNHPEFALLKIWNSEVEDSSEYSEGNKEPRQLSYGGVTGAPH